ncbi:MAG TPA: FHA domain-containing protein [Polyangiaceae bacterium]|nr:FHA domain-containing protein [Polyangiaceae bacterium]
MHAGLAPGRRAAALRVAKGLLDKGRTSEALSVLAAWAASGPNDAEGQNLLAEALRIDPASRLAQLAFERMEGIAGDQAILDDAIAVWSPEEIARLDREMARPSFVKAQLGFNNNVKYKDRTFHVQTEDSGLDKPHVITHLFADGGRVVKSYKRSYAEHVRREDVAQYVRQLMKAMQFEMALALREGRFDAVIEGRAVGGLEVLDYPPKVDVQKLATQKKSRIKADGESAAIVAGDVAAVPSSSNEAGQAHFRLLVLRSLGGGPAFYEPKGREAVIGAAGDIALPGERFCHPREAIIRFRDRRLWLHDFELGNGAFLRIRAPVELGPADEFVVGDQLLRIERNPAPKDGPGPGPTYFYSSPKWISSFRVVQIFEGGALGACVLARGTTLQIGSAYGDFVFPSDPLVSEEHCLIEEQAGSILLTDLGSRTGVFVRIKGEQEIVHGDELLVGRTRLSVELLSPSRVS